MLRLAIAIVMGVATLWVTATEARAQPCNANSNAHANTDPTRDATALVDIQPDVCIEREILFMPGLQGIVYAPRGAAEPFVGAGVQIAPVHWSHNNDKFGPSQGAVFIDASLLESPSESGAMAIFDFGFSLSFERNASRRFLIPYFGTTFGGTVHEELPNSGFAYPFGGIHLYWHHNLVVNAEGGYHFPFAHIDELRGPRAELIARFSMW